MTDELTETLRQIVAYLQAQGIVQEGFALALCGGPG